MSLLLMVISMLTLRNLRLQPRQLFNWISVLGIGKPCLEIEKRVMDFVVGPER